MSVIEINPLKIAILSQNAVSESTNIHIEDIEKNNPDIYVEMTQEDKRMIDKRTIISQDFINNYTLLHTQKLLRVTHFTGYNIVIKIYVNKSYNIPITVEKSGNIPLKSGETVFSSLNPMPTKGAVYVKLNIPNHYPIMLVDAHLPMLKIKDANGNITDDLGFDFRTKSLNIVLNELLNNGLDHDTTLVFGGDLNYRITHKGIDQLTELLKHNNPFKDKRKPLLELEMNPYDKTFTCKFQEKNPDEDCRNTIEPANIDNDNDNEIKDIATIETVQKKCGDAKRFPSRCDRFLISEGNGNDKVIKVVVHKGHYFKEIKSDHNTIYSVFNYDNPKTVEFVGGKKNKKQNTKNRKHKTKNSKSRKYKTKKN
jgi:hypothetical protein